MSCLALSCLLVCTTTCQFLPRPTSHPPCSTLLPPPSTFLFNRRPGQRGHHTPYIHFTWPTSCLRISLSTIIAFPLQPLSIWALVSVCFAIGIARSVGSRHFWYLFQDLDITNHDPIYPPIFYHMSTFDPIPWQPCLSCLSSTLLLHVALNLPYLAFILLGFILTSFPFPHPRFLAAFR
jgi:hypothetical protein